jgi:hypothetical protein
MINDINIGGVFIPGLLLTALAPGLYAVTRAAFLFSRLYRRLPCARCLISQPIS